jgi:hypothetical protein
MGKEYGLLRYQQTLLEIYHHRAALTAWPEAQHKRYQRTLLYVQAKKWSDQVLEYSGLLE